MVCDGCVVRKKERNHASNELSYVCIKGRKFGELYIKHKRLAHGQTNIQKHDEGCAHLLCFGSTVTARNELRKC